MTRVSASFRLWLPQYWPTWLGLGLFWLLSRLPWPVQRFLARGLGWLVYYVVPVRRHVTLVNLRLCFPEKSEEEIRRLARAHYHALALGLFEVAVSKWSTAEQLPPYRLVGGEHLTAALAAGHGAILLTAHFTTLELSARMVAAHFKMGALYRNPNNPVLAKALRDSREKHSAAAIPFDDMRGLLRALKSGLAIWYAPDQAKRTKATEILPFFGVPAITNTATSKLAEMTGAPVVPYFARREEDGFYTLNILPALENFPSADATADALRINQLIEAGVRQAPEQYFWVHKRFKARGPGYPEVY